MTQSLGDALAAMLSDDAPADEATSSGSDGGPTGTRAEVTEVLRPLLADDDGDGDDGADESEPPALSSRLGADLGLDSLSIVEFFVRLEESSGVRIADEDIADLATLGDVVDYLDARREDTN
ncbi:acyl carrier protein [Corynebacterium sp. TAE3-ERU12]|uniref:acyl carrier protein n=1 Tax=Corynebacterium sp. TAE3-ERU12 TaxID=2849491 RepID=UPI001C43E33E|nr:phosphopantetheine-binding protein [Corynebacterium sp. TAE3-ERU12]MBV7295800.1 acyl carrier protein [Corynebacterium sp. TAE3-ERU12]